MFVIVLSSRCRNRHQLRGKLRSQALVARNTNKRSRLHSIAGKPSLKLLIRRQPTQIDSGLTIDRDRRATVIRIAQAVRIGYVVARYRTRSQTTVEPPVKPDPRAPLAGYLILQVRRLVVAFVVVNTEWISTIANSSACAPLTCGGKKRAATEDITTNADKLWKFGTSARNAKPGIFELCQSIGNVIGVLPSTLKSKALCVYFQM